MGAEVRWLTEMDRGVKGPGSLGRKEPNQATAEATEQPLASPLRGRAGDPPEGAAHLPPGGARHKPEPEEPLLVRVELGHGYAEFGEGGGER